MAFTQLKQALTNTPLLALPNFDLPFKVHTDASGFGIGAVLVQSGHRLAYFSKSLSPKWQSASTYAREMLAITEAVHKWRQYLLGAKFIIYTDHQSIRGMLKQTIQTPNQQQWLSKLLGFNFDLYYKLGKNNTPTDALSRSEEPSLSLYQASSTFSPE